VFVTGDPVVGVLVLVPEADHLFLESIAVHPQGHGRGLGRRLLAFTEDRARERGLPEIRLYTNALMWENQKIYPRYGYEVTERRQDGPYDRIHYRKRL
jgi:ribosomal protein S18 acetylase RimI-like enzyme